jgi:GNAT superfamily N-acetyltransferase
MTAQLAPSDASWEVSDVRSLFSTRGLPGFLEIEAALCRQTPCRFYVDHWPHPQAAALQVGVCWHLAGEPNPPFLRDVYRLLPRDAYCVLIPPQKEAPKWIAPDDDDLYFVRARSRYASRRTSVEVAASPPDGYSIAPIDQALLTSDLDGASDLVEGILETWTSVEAFCRRGFGFVGSCGGTIVSHSLTDYVCAERCEIGVETQPAHRLKGLGSYVAAHTADEAFRRGLGSVGWMCWANNAGSIAVSQRAGFVEEAEYDVYINHWPAENPENMTAQEYRDFALDYEERLAATPPKVTGYPYLVAATARALAGDSEACRRNLSRAIDLGWLQSLEQLRELWPELLESGRVFTQEPWRDLFKRLA